MNQLMRSSGREVNVPNRFGIPMNSFNDPMQEEELFDIRITRTPNSAYDDDGGIGVDEWLALVEDDPELTLRDHLMGRNPMTGEAVRVPLQHGAVWHWDCDERGAVFTWRHGQIRSQWVDQGGQEKARRIGAALTAHVLVEAAE